jgi:hypothetical protein
MKEITRKEIKNTIKLRGGVAKCNRNMLKDFCIRKYQQYFVTAI